MRHQYHRGFTIVEILVAMAILLAVGYMSLAAFSGIARKNAVSLAAQDVVTTLTRAQSDTFASRNDTVYGAHLDTDEVVYFVGGTYTAGTPTNRVVPFEGGVVASVNLTGGNADIVFSRLTGLPSATGTIVLTEPRTERTATVTIYASGLIE